MDTHREYQKDNSGLLPAKKQDFVFIGHNGGLGHLLLINGNKIGRIICILHTPIDYIYPSRYAAVNKDIVKLIKDQYDECGTRGQ